MFNGVAHTPFRCVLTQFGTSVSTVSLYSYKILVNTFLQPDPPQNLVDAFCKIMDSDRDGEIVAEEHNALRTLFGLEESDKCIQNQLQYLPSNPTRLYGPYAQSIRDSLDLLFRTQTAKDKLYGNAPAFDYMNFLYGS